MGQDEEGTPARLKAVRKTLVDDDAVRRIVDLCMKANDMKTAQILYRAIQATWIREAVHRDHPALGQ
jgi:hypothetical protein